MAIQVFGSMVTLIRFVFVVLGGWLEFSSWNQSIDIGSSSGLFCCSRCAESYRRREIASECSKARSILGYVFLILVHWTWFLLYVSHRTTT